MSLISIWAILFIVLLLIFYIIVSKVVAIRKERVGPFILLFVAVFLSIVISGFIMLFVATFKGAIYILDRGLSLDFSNGTLNYYSNMCRSIHIYFR